MPSGPPATPREESAPADINTKNVTKENLSVIDRQIAAASSLKSKKRLQETEPERNAKKPRVDHPEPKVILHKAKVIITYGRADKRRAISLTPRSLAHKTSSGKVKREDPTGDVGKVNLQTQPRANNGRFAKKYKIANVSPGQNRNISASTSSQKRRNEEMDDLEESPRKRSANAEKEDEDLPTVQKVHRPSGFHAGRLFCRPNPQQFALRAWSNMMLPDDSSVSSEDDTHPITPEDDFPSQADIVDPSDTGTINRFSLPRARASLSCINPSPLVFAKNRWNSFGQVTPKSKLSSRRLSLDELYISEAEVRVWNQVTSITHGASIQPTQQPDSHCPPPSDESPSETESLRSHYRPTYPVLSPSAVRRPFVAKGTRFFSDSMETKTTLVNAGWDDASDATEP